MSVDYYQRSVNSLDKDIAALEKKKAEADKKYAELSSKISSTQKSITPRTSASIAASKLKQISGWESAELRNLQKAQIWARSLLRNVRNVMMPISSFRKHSRTSRRNRTAR